MLAQAASVASRYTRSAPMAWVLRARAPAARLIAASRSGLSVRCVRRSALSGVRPSACCTPALTYLLLVPSMFRCPGSPGFP